MHNEVGHVELGLVRLKRRADFLRVARSGQRFAATGLVLQVADRPAVFRADQQVVRRADRPVSHAHRTDVPAPDAGAPNVPPVSVPPLGVPPLGRTEGTESAVGIGFTVSKKVGNAVARNRAKRRLRAVVAELMPTYAAPDRDYVLIGRKATLDRSYSDLLSDLKHALKRTKSLARGPRLQATS